MSLKNVALTSLVLALFACSEQAPAPQTGAAGSASLPAAAPSQPTNPAEKPATSSTSMPAVAAASVSKPMMAANPAVVAAPAASVAAAGGMPAAVSGTPMPAMEVVGPAGISKDPVTGDLVFRTEPIALAAGTESYTCFAATLEQAAVVDGFVKSAQQYVHHAQFVKALAPEPQGVSVCNEQFKLTWMPIFLAGNGASELRFDEGIGHVLEAGTQLVLQMHLLNSSDKDAMQAVEIRMHQSASPNPTPVAAWAIGSSQIQVPARTAGMAQNVCTMGAPVELLAVFPHMHRLGQRFNVEVGKSLDTLRPLYARDPFDFDDQRMEKVKIKLEAGDVLRVTCDFMNTTDKVVGFGESTDDEMCFFVGFALGDAPAQADCPNLWEALFAL